MVMMLEGLTVHVSEFEVIISCQGGKKVIMKFIGSVFMCHPFYKTSVFGLQLERGGSSSLSICIQ